MVVQSNIVVDGNLICNVDWCNYVDKLKLLSTKNIGNEEEAIVHIKKPFINAVKSRIPNKKFGIFFSGGVDSTAIAYLCNQLNADFICYTVGIEGSQDIEEATVAAKVLGFTHKKQILSLDELEEVFESLSKILPKDVLNVVNLGVGAVILAAINLAKKDNIDTFFSGLGSEELFAGYQRHEQSSNVNEECWTGIKSTWQRDFVRDFSIAKYTKTTFLTPFLDRDLIIKSMEIGGSLKIKEGIKKYIFRKVIQEIGLQNKFSFRPKKAAQYGSKFDKALQRIAKLKGFKFKREYIEFLSHNK